MYIKLIELSNTCKLTSSIRCSDMLGLGQSYTYCPPGGDTSHIVKEHNHYLLITTSLPYKLLNCSVLKYIHNYKSVGYANILSLL